MSVKEFATVEVEVGGNRITEDVIWAETTFQMAAAAQPGTFNISVRDPYKRWDFKHGKGAITTLWINDKLMFQGYVMTVQYGYVFPDVAQRKWTLGGTDLNILFDRLIMYNHANPAKYPDGGGTYHREEVTLDDGSNAGWVIAVPQATEDRDYILAMLKDFDIPGGPNDPSGRPIIHAVGADNYIDYVSTINPDGKFTPPGAGTTLRGFMTDVSTSVQRQLPGSTIWYIDPQGNLIYKSVELIDAPHSVGDDDTDGWDVRDLSVTIGVDHIKNDVLIFSGETSPLPASEQQFLLFKHNSLTKSVSRFGRFQSSEVLSGHWLQGMVNARSTKLLYQEGGPSVTAEFTIFRSGFYVDQVVTISSGIYTYRRFDTTFGEIVSSAIKVPIRSIDMSFPEPNVVAYRVTCSYDTQDPWGLLLALKRPAQRGITAPNFTVVDLRPGKQPGPDHAPLSATPMMFVKEYPKNIGGDKFQCHYAYIRNSLTVVTIDPEKGGKRLVSFPPDSASVTEPIATGTAGYVETDPEAGIFFSDVKEVRASGKVYCEYHVWKDRAKPKGS